MLLNYEKWKKEGNLTFLQSRVMMYRKEKKGGIACTIARTLDPWIPGRMAVIQPKVPDRFYTELSDSRLQARII